MMSCHFRTKHMSDEMRKLILLIVLNLAGILSLIIPSHEKPPNLVRHYIFIYRPDHVELSNAKNSRFSDSIHSVRFALLVSTVFSDAARPTGGEIIFP